MEECDYSTAGKQLFNALRGRIPVVDDVIAEDFEEPLP